ncbi:MAG: hypothetical protein ACP5H2_02575 [Solirubrobacteraceae bacterium]
MLALLRREPVLLGILGFAVIFFAYHWAVDLDRPGTLYPNGWRGYNDQGFYLREALDLIHLGYIPSGDFAYGPGYPLLAVPFAAIGPHGWPFQDPFAFADLASWLLTIGVTYLVGRRLGGEIHGVVSAGALMLATPLIGLVTLPWNTTAVLAAGMIVLAVALSRRLRWWHGGLLGLAVGLAYSARYVDALWVGVELLTVLYARRALSRKQWPVLVAVMGGAFVLLLPTLWLQWKAFGRPFTTTYGHLNSVNGSSFALHNIGLHALDTFVSPFFFPEHGQRSTATPLLSSMFLIVLVPIGYWLELRRSPRPRRTLALGFGLASLAATLFYLSYWYTGPYGLGFGAIRFFEMWLPLWVLAAVTAVIEGIAWLRR